MQDYRTNNMRLQELTHQRDQRNDATQKFVQSLGDTSGEHTQGVSGNQPASDMGLKASTLDAGVTPRIHGTQMPPELANSLRLQAVVDPEGAMREAAHFYASQGSQEAHREPLIHSNITNEYGDQIENVIDPNPGGSQRQFYLGGSQPKPEKTPTPLHDSFVDAGGNQVMSIVDPTAGTAKNVTLGKARPPAAASAGAPGSSPDDPDAIADAIYAGRQPPTTTGLYRNAAAVRAKLERKYKFDLSGAQLDYSSWQKHLATMNGAQQERLRQAVTFAHDSLEQIEGLYDEWQKVGPASGFKVFNRAAIAAAKQVPGRAGEIAQTLEAQIADLTSELGTVYKGGNSATDHGLELAAKNLSIEWNEGQFKSALKALRSNLVIRRNSIMGSQAVGVAPGSPYAVGRTPPPEDPGVVAAPTAGSGQATPAGGQAAPAGVADGNYTVKGQKVTVRGGVMYPRQ